MYRVTSNFHDIDTGKVTATHTLRSDAVDADHAQLIAHTDATQYVNALPKTSETRIRKHVSGIVVSVDGKPSISYRWQEV